MHWTQNYDPFGMALPAFLLAALPVLLLLGLLGSGRVPAPLAAAVGLTAAFLAAVLGFAPVEVAVAGSGGVASWGLTVLSAAIYGLLFGLFPIGWIVVAAIFLYTLTVESGQFDVVKRSVLALSPDRRIQALLIAFSFGSFVEGAAGFGTPVAISGALLVGAGFKPLHAAGLALLANTSPVAFGALGTPITTLSRVTGLDELELSAMCGRQLPFFSLIVPVWLVGVMAGWRGILGVWPALLVCGGSFAGVQFLVANYHGPWLVDVAAGLISLLALALWLQVWQPRDGWQPDLSWRTETAPAPTATAAKEDDVAPLRFGMVLSAWVPWLLLTVFVFAWGLPPVKALLGQTTVRLPVPGLHEEIQRVAPVVDKPHREAAIWEFNWLNTTGTSIFIAALLSAAWMQIPPQRVAGLFGQTIWKLRWPLVTIACMLAIAFTTRYSGMDATLGLAFTHTGWLYPIFAALLGWLGVALTGSDTSANALFGNLQTITARRLVETGVLPLTVHQASVLLAAANSSGGVMGKMIDAQSIVVAAAATQQPAKEGEILRYVLPHSIILALLMGCLVWIQAFWWPGSIP